MSIAPAHFPTTSTLTVSPPRDVPSPASKADAANGSHLSPSIHKLEPQMGSRIPHPLAGRLDVRV